MTWPPNNQPTGGKSDSTPMATDHPSEHNAIKDTLDDIIAENAGALPLSGGGTVTGDIQVNGIIKAKSSSLQTEPSYGFATDTTGLGMFGSPGSQWLRLTAGGVWRVQVGTERVTVKNDLQVDGTINAAAAGVTFTGGRNPSSIDIIAGSDRSALVMKSSDDADSARLVLYGGRDSVAPAQARMNIGEEVVATWQQGGLLFNIAAAVDTADVLERAELATMPAVGAEDAATLDDGGAAVTVNEVITGLLAKVKELSTRLEALET